MYIYVVPTMLIVNQSELNIRKDKKKMLYIKIKCIKYTGVSMFLTDFNYLFKRPLTASSIYN
jgi:hypothetical protein